MMLAPNEVLYANFICRNIHFVHHVVEFFTNHFRQQVFSCKFIPPHSGKRRMKLMMCQISLRILL